MLLDEEDLPIDVLELLATDFVATVQQAAQDLLDRRLSGDPILPDDLLDGPGDGTSDDFFGFDEEPAATFGRWDTTASANPA